MCCDMTGLVFDIQRFSLNDGPGIRTTIFLKGCPLHCAWCHNPESQSFKPELMLDVSKCIGCGKCFGTCTNHRAANGVHNILREVCTGCGSRLEGQRILGKRRGSDGHGRRTLGATGFYVGTLAGISCKGHTYGNRNKRFCFERGHGKNRGECRCVSV